MISSLSNKTAFVTGASRGIGRATALVLASRGAYVLVTTAKGLPRRKRWLLRLIGTVERLIQRAQALSPQTRPHAQTFLRDAVSARCELLPGRHCEAMAVRECVQLPRRSRTAKMPPARASYLSNAVRTRKPADDHVGVCDTFARRSISVSSAQSRSLWAAGPARLASVFGMVSSGWVPPGVYSCSAGATLIGNARTRTRDGSNVTMLPLWSASMICGRFERIVRASGSGRRLPRPRN